MWIDVSQKMYPGMPVWPGDKNFEYKAAMKISEGDSVNTGIITMSSHTGTHVDAPYHYDNDGKTIEDINVNDLCGAAEVVELTGVTKITKELVQDIFPLKTSIVLFKTTEKEHNYDSYPAFEAEAVHLLADKGVSVIGTDGPSVDPLTSTALPAHKTCRDRSIFIIEGLRLQVSPGFYELMAVPLALAEADGCPVRAVLRPWGE